MKCKYMFDNGCCCAEFVIKDLDAECPKVKDKFWKNKIKFNFEKFWEENMLSEEKYGHIDLSCRKAGNSFEYMIQFWDETGEFIRSFESESLVEVCEQALKWKEENEKS